MMKATLKLTARRVFFALAGLMAVFAATAEWPRH
jgi:hypothetical protein